MARRWKLGMLLGVVWASGLPATVQAQGSTDPVPMYQATPPGNGQGIPQSSAPYGPPMNPMAGYAPGMGGGGPPCPPGGGGLMEGWSISSGELDDDCWHYYINGGWVGLRRHPMKDQALAVRDPIGFDDGLPPPSNSRPLLSFADVEPSIANGGRLTLGLYSNGMCIEICGMFLPKQKNQESVTDQGSVSSFFFNPPLGFEGTNPGLWDNADVMTLTLSSRLASGEANVRWFQRGYDESVEVFFGCRYVDFSERMGIFTDDDSVQFANDPLSVANYTTQARNYMMGLQAGVSMHSWLCDCVAVSCDARGCWMADYATTAISLTRGDGLVGRDGGVNKWGFAQIYEAGAYLELTGARCRLRAGYQGMLLYHVATAQNQLDFDLSNGDGRGNVKGTVFYHGPAAFCEFIF